MQEQKKSAAKEKPKVPQRTRAQVLKDEPDSKGEGRGSR